MSYHFRPATRANAKLLIGLVGPTGSGKTLSAIKLATGMGKTVAVIDTEKGRACQYAGDYSFLHEVLDPPFSPKRYREIIEAAYSIKPDVVVIDSMSHVWDGIGGVLDTVERSKASGRQDMGIWAGPKQEHQKMVNLLLQSPSHTIMTFRGKEKKGMVQDPKTRRTEIVNLGWHPVAESNITYELTINVLLSSEKKGVPIVEGFDFGKLPFNMAHLMPANEPIGEETGARFAAWACEGSTIVEPRKSAADLLRQIENCVDPAELEPLADLVDASAAKEATKERLAQAITEARTRLQSVVVAA